MGFSCPTENLDMGLLELLFRTSFAFNRHYPIRNMAVSSSCEQLFIFYFFSLLSWPIAPPFSFFLPILLNSFCFISQWLP